ncbi:MAG: L,D-transpeptidase [Bacteroidales bacterium]|nr:L,D-transpeptidase [Bacteroidales bacterium]
MKLTRISLALAALAAIMLQATACSGKQEGSGKSSDTTTTAVAEQYKDIYHGSYDKDKSFIVVSKKDLKLTVYTQVNGDTVPVAQFPVCLSLNKGQKEKEGDMRTPESEPGSPFVIDAIKPASDWTHDFGDGRGAILAYGAWFLRLVTPGHHGIGIHGSTNNENSVPGRASEGCIRLRDQDIITLKEQYAWVGMPVIIKQEEQGLKSFEIKH